MLPRYQKRPNRTHPSSPPWPPPTSQQTPAGISHRPLARPYLYWHPCRKPHHPPRWAGAGPAPPPLFPVPWSAPGAASAWEYPPCPRPITGLPGSSRPSPFLMRGFPPTNVVLVDSAPPRCKHPCSPLLSANFALSWRATCTHGWGLFGVCCASSWQAWNESHMGGTPPPDAGGSHLEDGGGRPR